MYLFGSTTSIEQDTGVPSVTFLQKTTPSLQEQTAKTLSRATTAFSATQKTTTPVVLGAAALLAALLLAK